MTALGAFLNEGVAVRKGDAQSAAAWMRRGIAQVDWLKQPTVAEYKGWRVYADDCLEFAWVSVSVQAQYIIFSRDTWGFLSAAPAIKERVLSDLVKGSSGLKMLQADTVRDLVMMQEWRVTREDSIVELEKMANQLMLEAARINGRTGVSTREIKEFTLRSTQLQNDFAEVSRRVEVLRELVDASTDVVSSALTELE